MQACQLGFVLLALLVVADAALYKGKQAGRNRVVIDPSPGPAEEDLEATTAI